MAAYACSYRIATQSADEPVVARNPDSMVAADAIGKAVELLEAGALPRRGSNGP